MLIHLADDRGLNAELPAERVRARRAYVWVDPDNQPAESVRLVRATQAYDLPSLLERCSGSIEDVADLLLETDLDVDMEWVGTRLDTTRTIYVNVEGAIVHALQHVEVLYTPDGEVRERRALELKEANVDVEVPLAWTNRVIPKDVAVRRFMFSRTLQLRHRNGLEYDFLFRIASALAAQNGLLVLGGGREGRQPLVFQRGGLPYRGFLEGRVRGEAYLLLLHLSNTELKRLDET